MTHPTANPLVMALANGQPEAFAALYDRLGPSMVRFAAAMFRASGEAEDAVQDVFVELVRRRADLAQVRDLDAYVFTMLRHTVSRRMERERKEQHHLRQLTRAGVEKADECATDGLAAALQSLPPEQREVIALKVDGGLTFAQIAQVLNVNPNTAASRYRYALEKLRGLLVKL